MDFQTHQKMPMQLLFIWDSKGNVHVSLVTSKTMVALSSVLPFLSWNSEKLSKLLNHTRNVFNISIENIGAWTNSTVVLSWLSGSLRWFKTFVRNRVVQIINWIPCEQWKHVPGNENPADFASRELFSSDLVHHKLWWDGPTWLRLPLRKWPVCSSPDIECFEESSEIVSHVTIETSTKPCCIAPVDRYSSFERIQWVIAWTIRFVCKYQPQKFKQRFLSHQNYFSQKSTCTPSFKSVTSWRHQVKSISTQR